VCKNANYVCNKYDEKIKYDVEIMVIFSPVRCKLDEFVHGVFLLDDDRPLAFLLLNRYGFVVDELIRFHVAHSMVVRRLNADG